VQLYRLSLATILQRKVWVVALLWLLLIPAVLPNIMSYNISLVQPARAQAVWVSLWLLSITWIFFQGARLGEDTARSGLGAYFSSVGVSKTRQLFQISGACSSFFLSLIVIAVAICLFTAMPGDSKQAEMWVMLNVQYGLLFFFVTAPLLLLSIALGSRLGTTVGYVVPLALVLYGLYGVNHMGSLLSGKDAGLEWLFVFSPHYHLADLTERMVFKQGSLVTSEFLQILGYFTGIGLVTSVISILCFRVKSLA
jgi:hypothetical protein